MASFSINGTTIFYTFYEKAGAPVLLFSNSLGTDHQMWNDQVEVLKQKYSILLYDTRGHGQSGTTPGEYSIALLAGDVLDLLDYLKIDRVIFCGLSMGGLIGQWLGIYFPTRLHKLVVCNTAVKIGSVTSWNERIIQVFDQGLNHLSKATIQRWFTPSFVDQHPLLVNRIIMSFLSCSSRGYISCCAAVRDADFTADVHEIRVPTLVIAGEQDPVTTVEDGKKLAEKIPQAEFITLPAAHLSVVEAGSVFTNVLRNFIDGNYVGQSLPKKEDTRV